MKKTILVTNDDGIRGAGLKPLVSELKKIARVVVIVPERDRSAVSHSITLTKPLHVKEVEKGWYTTDGTPADCVRFGVVYMLKRKVDLVISGINTGPNLGQDVIYSGTVAGAREGAILEIPAVAASVADMNKPNYPLASRVVRQIAQALFAMGRKYPQGSFLNVNIPHRIKGVQLVALGKRIYDDTIECRRDPRGRKYYWLSGKSVSGILQAGMDITAVEQHYVAITPLPVTPHHENLFELLMPLCRSLDRCSREK